MPSMPGYDLSLRVVFFDRQVVAAWAIHYLGRNHQRRGSSIKKRKNPTRVIENRSWTPFTHGESVPEFSRAVLASVVHQRPWTGFFAQVAYERRFPYGRVTEHMPPS